MKTILGISAFYHDSAATILVDGKIIAAVQEERFTRKKHDASFPHNSIQYILDNNKILLEDIDHVVFYDKPFLKSPSPYNLFCPGELQKEHVKGHPRCVSTGSNLLILPPIGR